MAVAEIIVQGLVGGGGVLVGALLTHRWELAHRIRQRRRDEANELAKRWEAWFLGMSRGHQLVVRCLLFHREDRRSLPGRAIRNDPSSHYTVERWALQEEQLRLHHDLLWSERRAADMWMPHGVDVASARKRLVDACVTAVEYKGTWSESGKHSALEEVEQAYAEATEVMNEVMDEQDRRLLAIDRVESQLAGVDR